MVASIFFKANVFSVFYKTVVLFTKLTFCVKSDFFKTPFSN